MLKRQICILLTIVMTLVSILPPQGLAVYGDGDDNGEGASLLRAPVPIYDVNTRHQVRLVPDNWGIQGPAGSWEGALAEVNQQLWETITDPEQMRRLHKDSLVSAGCLYSTAVNSAESIFHGNLNRSFFGLVDDSEEISSCRNGSRGVVSTIAALMGGVASASRGPLFLYTGWYLLIWLPDDSKWAYVTAGCVGLSKLLADMAQMGWAAWGLFQKDPFTPDNEENDKKPHVIEIPFWRFWGYRLVSSVGAVVRALPWVSLFADAERYSPSFRDGFIGFLGVTELQRGYGLYMKRFKEAHYRRERATHPGNLVREEVLLSRRAELEKRVKAPGSDNLVKSIHSLIMEARTGPINSVALSAITLLLLRLPSADMEGVSPDTIVENLRKIVSPDQGDGEAGEAGEVEGDDATRIEALIERLRGLEDNTLTRDVHAIIAELRGKYEALKRENERVVDRVEKESRKIKRLPVVEKLENENALRAVTEAPVLTSRQESLDWFSSLASGAGMISWALVIYWCMNDDVLKYVFDEKSKKRSVISILVALADMVGRAVVEDAPQRGFFQGLGDMCSRSWWNPCNWKPSGWLGKLGVSFGTVVDTAVPIAILGQLDSDPLRWAALAVAIAPSTIARSASFLSEKYHDVWNWFCVKFRSPKSVTHQRAELEMWLNELESLIKRLDNSTLEKLFTMTQGKTPKVERR